MHLILPDVGYNRFVYSSKESDYCSLLTGVAAQYCDFLTKSSVPVPQLAFGQVNAVTAHEQSSNRLELCSCAVTALTCPKASCGTGTDDLVKKSQY